VMEGGRNKIPGLKGRAIAGPDDYEQIPALVQRSMLGVKNSFADLDERLAQVPFVTGERYSAADITTLVTVDFAKALELSAFGWGEDRLSASLKSSRLLSIFLLIRSTTGTCP
jgi:glutathione S-transferase